MNIPAERQQQIISWLAQEGALSITELQKRLGVSHMTVHRDLDRLVEQGVVDKVRGGAVFNPDGPGLPPLKPLCAMCKRAVAQRQEFIILRQGQPQLTACCPHCGLMLLTDASAVESCLTRDFLYGYMVNVYEASYVIASSVRLCCEPTVLCFGRIADAEDFTRGFGGRVLNFQQTSTLLTESHHS